MSTAVKIITTFIVLSLVWFIVYVFGLPAPAFTFGVAYMGLYIATSVALDFATFLHHTVIIKVGKDDAPPPPPTDSNSDD